METEALHRTLTPSLKLLLLSCFPVGTQIVTAQSYRPGYLPFPMCVHVQTPEGEAQRCVVKINRRDLIIRETRALRILARIGMPVPVPLSEPLALPSEDRALVVLSELSGRSLPWCGVTSLVEADRTCHLVLEAIDRLHQITGRLQEEEKRDTTAIFPCNTLDAEYKATVAEAGEWMQVSLFQHAVKVIGRALADATTPLVFSNGDYNPLNFLTDGGALCGFVDFEGACFENPHIGFAKFLIWKRDIYGWGTGAKVGLVERYLYSRNVSRCAFAPILVLRCLRHLIQDVSIKDSKDQQAREHILQIVAEGLQTLDKG